MPKSRYLHYYEQSICDTLISSGKVNCVMQLPCLKGLVIVASCSSGASNCSTQGGLALITGQRAKTVRAKRSIAAFDLREKEVVSCLVTLRGAQLHRFLDLLVTFVMPKWDFTAVNNSGRSLRDILGKKPNFAGLKHEKTSSTQYSTISFGQKQVFSFPSLEPYFSQLESTGGFNMHIMIDQKRCLHGDKAVIWGF